MERGYYQLDPAPQYTEQIPRLLNKDRVLAESGPFFDWMMQIMNNVKAVWTSSARADQAISAIITGITLPVSSWVEDDTGGTYGYRLDAAVEGVTEDHFPSVAIHQESMETAQNAEFSPVVQTLDGALRFRAKAVPAADILATAALFTGNGGGTGPGGSYVLPVAAADTLGGVKIGENVGVTEDGTISIDGADLLDDVAADDSEVTEMLNEVFGEESGQ